MTTDTHIHKIPVMKRQSRRSYEIGITRGKYNRLTFMAQELGKLRAATWQKFGSLQGVIQDRGRTAYEYFKAHPEYSHIPKKLIQACVKDTFDNIAMYREAVKVKVRQNIYNNKRFTQDEKKELYSKLKRDEWTDNAYLLRQMRKHYKKGKTEKADQINYEGGLYDLDVDKGFLAVQSFERGKRIRIPFTAEIPTHKSKKKGSDLEHSPAIRLMIKDDSLEVHYPVKNDRYDRPVGTGEIGLDKGERDYVFYGSNGKAYGKHTRERADAQVDLEKDKGKKRNKLRALEEKARATGDKRKAQRIKKNNLGSKKWDKRRKKFRRWYKQNAIECAHEVFDTAETAVIEDLSWTSDKKFSKKMNRRLAHWMKSALHEAMISVGNRRGASVVVVNAAYTSQMDSIDGTLRGSRRGDKFHRYNGEVLHADTNAALNILHRKHDTQLLYNKSKEQVKSILLRRTREVEGAEQAARAAKLQLQRKSGASGAPTTPTWDTATQLLFVFEQVESEREDDSEYNSN